MKAKKANKLYWTNIQQPIHIDDNVNEKKHDYADDKAVADDNVPAY